MTSIIECNNFSSGGQNTPCQEVVGFQARWPLTLRQVPEPWRGSLDAPILFVSSNPSHDLDDDSPNLQDWKRDSHATMGYFERGFPVPGFPKTRLRTGSLRKEWVRFWAGCRARAAEVMDTHRHDVRPGVDFTITELVHCKSQNEAGVPEAISECVNRHWFDSIVAGERRLGLESLHRASVIIVYGNAAQRALGISRGQICARSSLMIAEQHNERTVWMIALPHPNARKIKKSLWEDYNRNELADLMKELARRR
jgi:hypothetical protein